MNATKTLFFRTALLPDGWAHDVRFTIEGTRIARVESGASLGGDAIEAGVALPGMPNLHSHGFQRGMAGLAERGGPRDDHFWTWREVMYRFLAVLTPDDVEAITALAYIEMLEAGFTSVAEFHYLHNDVDGRPFADPGALSARIARAAAVSGIGLTLLPVFYAQGGFRAAPPSAGQRRFVLGLDAFARLVEQAEELVSGLPEARLGIAPHSLRAVTADDLAALVSLAGDRVMHIHIAEQEGEVADCLATNRERPLRYLLGHAAVGPRWCLIHATHLDEGEIASLAASGAVAGLCPETEANLGDGIFPGVAYLGAGGAFGVGTDSNIRISVAGELRALEYAQRLRDRARNRLAPSGRSTGRYLFDAACAGGARALDRDAGALESGRIADIVVLDDTSDALIGRSGDSLVDSWIFAGGAVRDVWVAGRRVVREGAHIARSRIARDWHAVARRLAEIA